VTSGNYVIHSNVGTALFERGDIEAAFNEYWEAIQICPTFSDAHLGLGNVFAVKGDMDAATHEFQEAIRLNPNNTGARNNLSSVLTLINRQDKTRK
jgi:Tfp pilus assembly protein PilF